MNLLFHFGLNGIISFAEKKMKTILKKPITLFLILSLAAVLPLLVNAKRPVTLNETITLQLRKGSEILPEKKAVVYVSLSVNADGKVCIWEMNSNQAEYMKFVKERLENFHAFESGFIPGKIYNYKINFNSR